MLCWIVHDGDQPAMMRMSFLATGLGLVYMADALFRMGIAHGIELVAGLLMRSGGVEEVPLNGIPWFGFNLMGDRDRRWLKYEN
jgi:hypothetical protein